MMTSWRFLQAIQRGVYDCRSTDYRFSGCQPPWQANEQQFDASELFVIVATYLGLKVPMFDGLVGRAIPELRRGGRQLSDANGARLDWAKLLGDA